MSRSGYTDDMDDPLAPAVDPQVERVVMPCAWVSPDGNRLAHHEHRDYVRPLFALTPEEVAAVNKLRARKVWQTRQTHLCRCDHNEYCQHCWPESFRPGGAWHGLGA